MPVDLSHQSSSLDSAAAIPIPGKRRPLWFLPAFLAFVCFVGGPLLASQELVAPMHGFTIFVSSAIFGAASFIWGIWLYRTHGVGKGIVSIAIGVIPLIVIGSDLVKAHDLPVINDISTDLDNPPAFIAARSTKENQDKDLSYPDEFKSIVRENYPGLISLQIAKPASATFAAIKRVVANEPEFKIERIDEPAMTLEGTAKGGVFHFVDDFVIRVQQLDAGAQVDMRSRSRVGRGDFGANAARIRNFFAKLSAEEGQATMSGDMGDMDSGEAGDIPSSEDGDE